MPTQAAPDLRPSVMPLAVDLRDEVARYAATRGITDGLKSGAAWVGIDALLGLLDAVPAGLLALVEKQVKVLGLANLIVTNVPGPRETRYLGGARVEALYPIFDGLGLGIAVFSYDGTLHVGLNADADLVPDLDKLRQGVEDAFQALLAAC